MAVTAFGKLLCFMEMRFIQIIELTIYRESTSQTKSNNDSI